tara:strand:+ start:57002 stop:57943 length:942 start_codon:yes stop_codon:yes gene_type:complete
MMNSFTWAKDILSARNIKIHGEFEPVRLMPWSNVYRVKTQCGFIFLKVVTPPFDIELKLLPYLTEHFPEAVPYVIASSREYFSLLMQDAGTPLRPVMQKNYQLNLAIQTLKTYANIQQQLSHKIDLLLRLGVPDWRLNTLPSHFVSLLEKEAFLKNDGLSSSDITKLHALNNQIHTLCDRILSYAIPETIEHGDMHDNNILINSQNRLIIHDWGDTVLTHPFFSLCGFLHSAVKQHHIRQERAHLEQAYCNMWLQHETKEKLQSVLSLINQLREIKFVLSFSRIAECPGMHDLGEYKGTIANALKAFIQKMHQ